MLNAEERGLNQVQLLNTMSSNNVVGWDHRNTEITIPQPCFCILLVAWNYKPASLFPKVKYDLKYAEG